MATQTTTSSDPKAGSNNPTYIYKICPSSSAPPTPLPTSLPLSDLDARDGFLHCSTSAQLLGTLNAFFANESLVYILRIPYDRVAPYIKWENAIGKNADEVGGCWDSEGRAGYFPHIYNDQGEGLKLGQDEVQDVGIWKRGEKGWSSEGWCWEGVDVPV